MWVTAGEWMALSISRARGPGPSWSNRRTPSPRSAHQDRPGGVERFACHLVVRVALPSRHSVALSKARKSQDPLVEPIAALAERLLYRPGRAGDEAV